MAGHWLRKIGELLLPEIYGDDQTHSKDPLDALASAYEQLVQLATQIESHAEAAPYPQVTRRLLETAAEKRAAAQQLKNIIESQGVSLREPVKSPASGKNHWERLKLDLADQRAFENFLAACEPRLRAKYPEIADFLLTLRNTQANHRETLAGLMALADPQATQT